MDSPLRENEEPQPQEPVVIQIDPKCLHSALKEFFEPLRTNDPRTDFFAIYRRESGEFDRDYASKYDEDLNTSLIFAGLFSAVSSAFIIDVQSKLEPDPNEMTVAYMQILIHAVNNTLFPDASPGAIAWTGPPPQIVTVQSLLYASLTTSLFAAFLAMLGKQWVNRYIRNRGGSAADKSRDRQRKLDGFKKWHIHLVIESLPVMLQLALLLLGCALSLYLWTINRTVAGVVVAVTLLGVTSYTFLTLAATLCYNCPYQTPPSILIRTIIRYLSDSDAPFARSLRSLLKPLPSIRNLKTILRHLSSVVRRALASFHCISTVAEEAEDIPLAAVTASPARIFEDVLIDWEVCQADVRCIAWVLDSTTDPDVIFSTVQFAVDMIWYPEIARALSPHILAELFFDCLVDKQVIPGKLEHANSIGMALASVLSIHLNMEPKSQALRGLCKRIINHVKWVPQHDPNFMLAVGVLQFIAYVPTSALERLTLGAAFCHNVPDNLSVTHRLWLSRVMLQVIWRKRHVEDLYTVLHSFWMVLLCKGLGTDDDPSLVTLKTNCFLIMAISLGLRIDIRDLYHPSDKEALQTARNLSYQHLQISIRDGKGNKDGPTWALSALIHLDPRPFEDDIGSGFSWITQALSSGYPEEERFGMAREVVRLLGKRFYSWGSYHGVKSAWIPPLLAFLSLSEKFPSINSPQDSRFIALHILSTSRGYSGFCKSLLPVLTSTLLPTHPLQSRSLALKIFHTFVSGWFSEMENVPDKDRGNLLEAIGDPFQFNPDLPLQDGKSVGRADYEPTEAMVVLIGFASSELWRNHLRRSNFTSGEKILSTREGKRKALRCMLDTAAREWSWHLYTPKKITAAIGRLEELQCPNIAEAVIMWAWTSGVVSPWEHDAWGLIQRDTLRFYRTHGLRRLTALRLHIMDTTMSASHTRPHVVLQGESSRQMEGPLRPAYENWTELFVSRACQLRRLYHLFGYNPATWNEAIASGVGREMDLSSGRSVTRTMPLTDWACDYP